MTVFTVTTANDENNAGASANVPGGEGLSLREAIALANQTDGECIIRFATGIDEAFEKGGLIRLTEGEIAITKDLTIEGMVEKKTGEPLIIITGDKNDDDVTLASDDATAYDDTQITDVAGSGADLLDDNSRIFKASREENGQEVAVDLSISGLLLTGGRTTEDRASGGAVYASGDLSLENARVSGNSTSGDSSNGGGLFSLNYATLTGSTVSGNSTSGKFSNGGGLYSTNDATLTGSTVSGNSTSGASSHGGGLRSLNDTTLTNSTVSGNSTSGASSHGGGLRSWNDVTLTNSTISGNSAASIGSKGGGVDSLQSVTLENSIVLGNEAFVGAEVTSGGSVTGLGSNIVGADGTAFDASGINNIDNAAPSDVFAEIATGQGVPAGAGVLADNGGPVQTIALLADASNPAIDAASGAEIPETDARGVLRHDFDVANNNDGASLADLGAYEARGGITTVLTVTTEADTLGGSGFSLRDAIATANETDGDCIIRFASGAGEAFEGGGLIRLTEGEIAISKNLTIEGMVDDATGEPLIIITGDKNGDDVTLASDDGDTAYNDALITDVAASLDGEDRLGDNSRIFNAAGDNGAVDLSISGLLLTGGRTTADDASGGAVYASGSVTAEASVISGNSTSGMTADGGGFFAWQDINLTSSSVSGNGTTGEGSAGGGIYSWADVNLTNSTISGNSTEGEGADGGGVYSSGNLTLLNSTVSGNSTAGHIAMGGGFYSAGEAALINSTVTGNRTEDNNALGGGAYGFTDVTLTDSIVLGNSAATDAEISTETGSVIGIGFNIAGEDPSTFDASETVNIVNAFAGQVFAQTTMIQEPFVLAGVLTDNGGPVRTIALSPDASNPAIDAALGAEIPATDARGLDRVDITATPGNGHEAQADIGAYEVQELVPRIDEVSYDAINGKLAVVGGNFVARDGEANDVDVTKLSFIGIGGQDYALQSTANVEIVDASLFAVTLAGDDIDAVNALFAPSDDVEYAMSAAPGWMEGAGSEKGIGVIVKRGTPAQISGDTAGTVTEDATVTVSGNLAHTDEDEAHDDDVWQAVEERVLDFGTLTMNAAGEWTYTLDNGHADVQALATGETLTDSAVVMTEDGTEVTIEITINGADEPASGGGGNSGGGNTPDPVLPDDPATPDDPVVPNTPVDGSDADDTLTVPDGITGLITVDGGLGDDKVMIDTPLASINLGLGENGFVINTLEDQSILVTNVEVLQFGDQQLTFDTTQAAKTMLFMYEVLLDRLMDVGGLSVWLEAVSDDVSFVDVANGFLNSPEFQQKFGELTNAEFVQLMYQNAFERAPDQAGYDHWLEALNSGEKSRAEVAGGFAQSVEIQNLFQNSLNDGVPVIL